MKTSLLVLCAALPLLAAVPMPAAAQTAAATTAPITLRYHWTPGDTKRYQMTLDTSMAMHMAGRTPQAAPVLPAIAQHMVMDYDITVQSVNPADGSATLTEHITRMTATINGQPLPQMDALVRAYKSGFTLVMSPAGKLLSMTLPDAVASKVPAGMDFSKMGSMAPATLPAFPITVGDTWQDSNSLPLFASVPGMSSLQITVFSTLAGVSAGAKPVADIHQTYQATLDGAVPTGTAAANVKMSGQIHGDSLVKFDIGSGSIAGQDGTMTMTTHVSAPNPSAAASPIQMQMQMQMTTHLVRLP